MVNYKNGKIYTLRTYNDDSLIYVGSTCQQLAKRHHSHKEKYKKYIKGEYHYITSFKIIECGNTYIELLENISCDSREELLTREGYWIRKIECVNRCIAGRTRKQYRDDNKYKIREQQKIYRDNHKDTARDYHIQYREHNKDKIRDKKKLYRAKNKDKIRDKKRLYRAKNKDKIKAHKNKKCICVCGLQYVHCNKARHMKTKRHNKLFLKVIEQRIKEMEKDIIYESSTKIF